MKEKKRISKNVRKMLELLIVLIIFPHRYTTMFLQIFRSGHPVRNLQFLISMLPNPTAVFLLVYMIVVIAFAVTVISTLVSLIKKPSRPGQKTVIEKQNEKEIDAIEKSWHSAYRPGKQRYLDELDELLKSGLLDEKGYKEMKEQYMKLPDNL